MIQGPLSDAHLRELHELEHYRDGYGYLAPDTPELREAARADIRRGMLDAAIGAAIGLAVAAGLFANHYWDALRWWVGL